MRPWTLIVPRAILLAGLLAADAMPAMHEFTGQAMHMRIVVYVVGVGVIPAWWLATRERTVGVTPVPYPLAADLFLLVPFFFDLTGNSFHLYARVDNYDDAAHLVGVASLTLCGAALLPRTLDPAVRATMAAGGGVFLGVMIELVEWVAFSHPVATGYVAYRDTVGDLAMDALGCVAAGVVVAWPAIAGGTRAVRSLR